MHQEVIQDRAVAASKLRDIEAGFRTLPKRERHPRTGKGPFRVVDPAEVMGNLHRPHGEAIVEEARKRPAYWAYRLLAREIGQQLYLRGGTGLMRIVCIEVGGFGAVLDKWWIGIGEGEDQWIG